MSFTLEKPFVVWDDRDGSRVEIGEDRDGLSLVEIREYAPDGTIGARMTMDPELWALLREYTR